MRLCDHIVVWAAQGLARAAAAGRPPLDQGQLLRLNACRDTLAEALRICAVQRNGEGEGKEGGGGAGGGMYERRLFFLDDLLKLVQAPSSELEGELAGDDGTLVVFCVGVCFRVDGCGDVCWCWC